MIFLHRLLWQGPKWEYVPVLMALGTLLSTVRLVMEPSTTTTTTTTAWTTAWTTQPYGPYQKTFEEANGSYGVQKLVMQHCLADAKGLCAASLRGMGDTVGCISNSANGSHRRRRHPPFVSLLDRHVDISQCRMTLTVHHDLPSHSNNDNDIDMTGPMTILLQTLIEEAYLYARVYYRTVVGMSNYGDMDLQGLEHFVHVMLGSWWDFFVTGHDNNDNNDKGNDDEIMHLTLRRDGNASSSPSTPTSVSFALSPMSPEELSNILNHVINMDGYANRGEAHFLDVSLRENFFFQYYLPILQTYSQDPLPFHLRDDTTATTTTTNNNNSIQRPIVTDNVLLSNCLWDYYDNQALLTTMCPQVMEEATIRLDELALEHQQQHQEQLQQQDQQQQQHKTHHRQGIRYERQHHAVDTTAATKTKNDDILSLSFLQWGYYGLSWVFVLAVVGEVYFHPKVLRRSRQCLLVHVVLSTCLLWYHPSSRPFWNATLLGLAGYSACCWQGMVDGDSIRRSNNIHHDNDDDNDDNDETEVALQSFRTMAYELPLLAAVGNDNDNQEQ